MGKKNEAARMLANLNGPWSNAACMGYCLIAMRRANLRPGAQRRVLMLQELPCNEHATDLYAFNYMSSIVGPAVLMAARGDELIGFAKSVAESICAEWEVPLEASGEGERFQTFNPD